MGGTATGKAKSGKKRGDHERRCLPAQLKRGGFFLGDSCVNPAAASHQRVHRRHQRPPSHRIDLTVIKALDATGPGELPTMFARSRNDLSLAVRARPGPTPYLWRNAEYDEVHFVQQPDGAGAGLQFGKVGQAGVAAQVGRRSLPGLRDDGRPAAAIAARRSPS